jgi:putative glutamine amidotransferase
MVRQKLPLVGVTPDTHGGTRLRTRSPDEKVLYVYDTYVRAVQDHGAAAVLLPVTRDRRALRDTVKRLDGLLLIGGNFDIPPAMYGESAIPELGYLKPERSEFEALLIEAALRRDLPMLGICGGMQTINVVLGGTLYQDIATQRPRSREHQQRTRKDRVSHRVRVEPGTVLHRILSSRRSRRTLSIGVNSTHHQAIKDLGRGLIASAHAADGIVEALESPRHGFVIGVQWHPELLYRRGPAHGRLFSALVRAAREFGDARCERHREDRGRNT